MQIRFLSKLISRLSAVQNEIERYTLPHHIYSAHQLWPVFFISSYKEGSRQGREM